MHLNEASPGLGQLAAKVDVCVYADMASTVIGAMGKLQHVLEQYKVVGELLMSMHVREAAHKWYTMQAHTPYHSNHVCDGCGHGCGVNTSSRDRGLTRTPQVLLIIALQIRLEAEAIAGLQLVHFILSTAIEAALEWL